jgi:single-stranded-DNA-specific exonuclease
MTYNNPMSNSILKRQLNQDERKSLIEFTDLEAHLLFHRGIRNSIDAQIFLNPKYDTQCHPAESLKDIDKGVTRVLDAMKKNEKICIYSDYDADGIPGAVILSDFFEKIGYTDFFVYIPHRNREGFGLNTNALEEIKDKDTKLVITIDCASANVSEVEYANSLGMDVIITDHHEVPDVLPSAYAIINPKQHDCGYPEKMLCGSGVIFKFVGHLIVKGGFDIHAGWEKWLLDMVGIATISDMVPLLGENRLFAYYGLEVLKKSRRPGLLKIFNLKKINQKSISEDDISFLVTPQINAASRMGEPVLAFNLLKSKTEADADIHARELMRINDRRKVEVAQIVKEIHKHIKAKGHDLSVIAYGNPNWQPSLMGLACSKIAEEFKKPVFLWGRGDGTELKGSCRTWGDVSVYELLGKLGDEFFIQYGGHEAAGGFVIKQEKVSELEDTLSSHLEHVAHVGHTYECDAKVSVDEITINLVLSIEKLAPYGMSNAKPLFAIEGIVCGVKNFGSTKNHFEIAFKKSTGEIIRAIAFFKTHESYRPIVEGEKIQIIGHIEKNFFAGRHTVQIKIVDVM